MHHGKGKFYRKAVNLSYEGDFFEGKVINLDTVE